MIDIHCHILPGLDDGPAHMEESIKMAVNAVDSGISTILATPHYNSRFINTNKEIIAKTEELNRALMDMNIPLCVLSGQEIRLFGEMLETYEKEELLSVNNNGNYIFVEFPANHVPHYAERVLFDLQLKGLTPIIVHPERNSYFMEQPDALFNFVKNGTLTQVTASSYIGRSGRKVKSFTQKIIESNLTHFIASDAHDTVKRPFALREAYEQVQKEYGTHLRYFFEENARLLTVGDTVMKEDPEKIKRRKILHFI
jgi:protein-tyrosine phosphatase